MKIWLLPIRVCAGLASASAFFLFSAVAADFTVSSPGSFYSINGQNPNPTLTLIRGRTYTFAIATSGSHPFRINSPAGTTTNNNISSGNLTFVVPTNAANYTYQCSIHLFGGQIVTIPPPPIRIVGFDFTSNIVLRSTGTNLFTLVPEYKTNLGTTNWFALTVQTNRFLSGTNETICGRPSGSNLFFRVRAVGN